MSRLSSPVAAADAVAAGAAAAGADRHCHGSWAVGGGVHYSIHK